MAVKKKESTEKSLEKNLIWQLCDIIARIVTFSSRLMRIHEHGLSDRENIRMYTKKPRCIGHAGNFVTASLVDTKPALLVLILGYSIAFFELLLEFSIRYIQNKLKVHPLFGARQAVN